MDDVTAKDVAKMDVANGRGEERAGHAGRGR